MEKISKEAAHYEPVATGKDKCSGCRHFQVLAPRHCEAVEGIISAGAWCKLWDEIKSNMGKAFRKKK